MNKSSIKRICLFAGYNKDGVIEDQVLHYMKELSSLSDVYYMADNVINDEEIAKLTPYAKAVYGYEHGKYDFGSWQELINILGWKKLAEYDELILTNDSVFGPVHDFQKFIDKIEKDKDWDLCGINVAYDFGTWHLSSYFLMLRKNGFLSDVFKNHIKSVKKEASQKDVIEKYEVGLSKKMIAAGYNLKNAVDFNGHLYLSWKNFLLKGSPLIKSKIFNDELFIICKIFGWEKFIKQHSNYDTSLLYKHIDRYKSPFRIFRVMKNKLFWEYFTKGIIRIIWLTERKLIRLLGISLINKYNYTSNKIKLIKY